MYPRVGIDLSSCELHKAEWNPSWLANPPWVASIGLECDGEDGQPLVVEQFTGLLDKNGVEIYEGDIVRMDDDWMPIGAVQFQQTGAIGWCIEGELGNGFKRRSLLDSAAYEIIGNIHTTPELLK